MEMKDDRHRIHLALYCFVCMEEWHARVFYASISVLYQQTLVCSNVLYYRLVHRTLEMLATLRSPHASTVFLSSIKDSAYNLTL